MASAAVLVAVVMTLVVMAFMIMSVMTASRSFWRSSSFLSTKSGVPGTTSSRSLATILTPIAARSVLWWT